ncbi:MAG: acetylxylan esterase, partial [Prevotella sp.]|nr:acetylxylan esterase [Prevotella sp.]
KNAYLTTEEIDFFDMTKCTNTWSSEKSSYNAATSTITWTDVTRHGWYINADTYNDYKTIVVEFIPAPVAITGYIRYKETSDASWTDVEYTVPAGATMVTLPVPATIYNIIAIHLQPASACSLTLTNAYATSKEYENSKTITLSTTETVVESWSSAGLMLTKEQMGLAQAGDKIAIHVSAISGDTHTAWLQNGSYSNFEGVSGVSITSASQVAYFTLTEAMLNYIHGNVDGVNGGLVVKGTGYTFNQIDLIHNLYKVKGQPATNIWSGSQVIDWSVNPSTYATLPASVFATASVGMKLRMSFNNLKLGAQGRLSSKAWGALPDANTYETLKSNWGNYYEFTITQAMLTELQANGCYVTGIGYTLTSVDLIDPDCEYNITSTFDNADIIAWETTDETPNLTVTITNNEAYEITVPINIALMTDMFTDYNTYAQNVTLAAGETKVTDVEFSDLTPGFYRMAANVAGNKLCTYYIGYDPTNIVSPDDSQPDFWQFWDGWKETLANIPIDATLTLLDDKSTGARNVYEVKYQSVPETVGGENVYIYGYYAEPKDAGTYPCLINFHGTDSGSGTPSVPGTDSNTGWCEFNFSARGQMLNRLKNSTDAAKYIPTGKTSADFYSYGLGSNDNHYYRYVYLDTRRAVDFVYSQEKVNKNAIFAAGGSQGGCLTYVCAGLSDGRIKAIAPSITGHADFPHTMEIVTWPTNVFNDWINANYPSDYEAGKEALLRHQSYFDTKNFASRITSAVITNFSLQDNTDGPHLNISPYNLLTKVAPEDKQYSINQFKGHSAKDGWSTDYMAFFEQYIDKAIVNVTDATYATYYNSTATQLPAGVQAATIDAADSNNGTVTVNWRYDGDGTSNVIPGGTAVMLKSTVGNYKLTLLPDNTDTAPTGNLLDGSDVRTTTSGASGDKFYKLSYGPSANNDLKDKLGWYWGADGGAAFTIDAHKAWLALGSGAGTRSFYSIDGDDTTGIGTIETEIDPNVLPEDGWYNLNGQRINKPSTPGLYIVNGKKIIVR